MMATLMGMKVVMMRKWDVEEGKTALFKFFLREPVV